MKKLTSKAFIILSLMFFCLILSSFSKNNMKTVKGYVHSYGNDPFAYLGIETDDNKKYAIGAEDSVIKELWNSQGNKIEITGVIIPKQYKKEYNMLQDGRIEVSEWKYVK